MNMNITKQEKSQSSATLLLSPSPSIHLVTNGSNLSPVINRCESWWDGIYQWPESEPNTIVSIPCHKIFALTMGNVNADDYDKQTLYAQRQCLANGQWGWNNWTNYTECLNLLALQEKDTSATNRMQAIISYIVLMLLLTSMVSLIISIVIFVSFKPLKCLRIRVHKNLCLALLMNCCLYIIMNSLVGIHKLDLSATADWFCKSLKSLNIYSSMATINWMFVEGFLFHRTLSSPFHQNTRLYQAFYYFIGWIFPAIIVITWSLCVEFVSTVANKPCWEGYRVSSTIFIVSIPMIVCVAINFMFLINIIRILLTKLRADRSDKSDSATIKAIKATALLIPLLGIHHLVVLYNPSTFNRKLVNIYIVVNVMFQSIQGVIVAILYCFTNQEVRTVLNAAWSRRRMSMNPGGSSADSNGRNKRRRQSNGSNSFPSLIAQQNIITNNNNSVTVSSDQQQTANKNNNLRVPVIINQHQSPPSPSRSQNSPIENMFRSGSILEMNTVKHTDL